MSGGPAICHLSATSKLSFCCSTCCLLMPGIMVEDKARLAQGAHAIGLAPQSCITDVPPGSCLCIPVAESGVSLCRCRPHSIHQTANSHGKTRSAQTSKACPADPSQQHRSEVCIQTCKLDTMPAMGQADRAEAGGYAHLASGACSILDPGCGPEPLLGLLLAGLVSLQQTLQRWRPSVAMGVEAGTGQDVLEAKRSEV